MSAYVPLATPADLYASPLLDLFRNLTAEAVYDRIVRASQAAEDYCRTRLSPFTVTESCRAAAVDVDETWDLYTPLDTPGQLALSRAQSLGAAQLVRHAWVRNRPPIRQELWSGQITTITIERSVSGSQTLTDPSQWQYEADTGHIRFYYGSFIPVGSTLLITYTGGYTPEVPMGLRMATLYGAAVLALVELTPGARPSVDLTELAQTRDALLGPFCVGADE
jgi:hypothetical protein